MPTDSEWTNNWPIGNQSAASNRLPGSNNSKYLKEWGQVDHYFKEGDTLAGHHKKVEMTKESADISTATDMDGAIYLRDKTNAESPDNEDTQPFFVNGTGATEQVMQMLGIRACCVFEVNGSGVVTEKYKHNITSITRSSAGNFSASFPALPSANYLVSGGCIPRLAVGSTGDFGLFTMVNSTDLSLVKTTTALSFTTRRVSTVAGQFVLIDPTQCWFMLYGG